MERMEELKDSIGVTTQQFLILKLVNELSISDKATPKYIMEAYQQTTKKLIQKTNLFAQIKTLVDRKLLTKVHKGHYQVNFETIQNNIVEAKSAVQKNLQRLDQLAEKTQEIFGGQEQKEEFLSSDEFFTQVSSALKGASDVFVAGPYTEIFSPTLPLPKEANVRVLTAPTEVNTEQEIKIVEDALKRLSSNIKEERITTYLTSKTFDMVIVKGAINAAYSLIRGSQGQVKACIKMTAPERLQYFEQLFQEECAKGKLLSNDNVDRFVNAHKEHILGRATGVEWIKAMIN